MFPTAAQPSWSAICEVIHIYNSNPKQNVTGRSQKPMRHFIFYKHHKIYDFFFLFAIPSFDFENRPHSVIRESWTRWTSSITNDSMPLSKHIINGTSDCCLKGCHKFVRNSQLHTQARILDYKTATISSETHDALTGGNFVLAARIYSTARDGCHKTG